MKQDPIISYYEQLLKAYTKRDLAAKKWKENGGMVVGCLGVDVPEEILIAAGLLPIRICGDPTASDELGDIYLEPGFDSLSKSQFSRIVDGTYSFLDKLVISNSSDAIIRIYHYLEMAYKDQYGKNIPSIYFVDFLHTPFRSSAIYNRLRIKQFIEEVSSWVEKPIHPNEIRQAFILCNENRQYLRKLDELRLIPRISGTQALQTIGASFYLPREEHTRLLKGFLEEAGQWPPIDGVRLYMAGSMHDHSHVYELVESCGAVIVGEDHALGGLHAVGDLDLTVDPVDAIADRFQFHRPLSTNQGTIKERVSILVKEVKRVKAQGVIFYIHHADDPPSWDYPKQREALEAMGIPTLLLDRQTYQINNKEELLQKIRTFVTSL